MPYMYVVVSVCLSSWSCMLRWTNGLSFRVWRKFVGRNLTKILYAFTSHFM